MYENTLPAQLNISFKNQRGKRGNKKTQKLGIIQAVLQTLNAKLQNTKIDTTLIWCVCVCVLTIILRRAVKPNNEVVE